MLALAAPLAMLFPVLGQSSAPNILADANPAHSTDGKRPDLPALSEQPQSASMSAFELWQQSQINRQVRIEQRVIIRISPARQTQRQNLVADRTTRPRTQQFEEKRIGKCLAVEGISGVQTDSGNRLLLFLRDRRIISLNLEKSCRARDFYSGFYVERSEDGQLCVDRDRLYSRNGAKCEIDRMRQLVAINE
jgi:hypothetical protein